MVRISTPISWAFSEIGRMFLVPASCPLARGRPSCCAQRPLPSMMIPTCRGMFRLCESSGAAPLDGAGWTVGLDGAMRCRACARLDLHDLGFFGVADVVDLFDVLVGQLLQPILGSLVVVGGKRLGLLHV